MSDFTLIQPMFNTGSEGTPTWTAGSFVAANNEVRWCAAGAGAGGTSSATWPQYARPVATGVVPEMWSFTADTTGLKVAYDGTLTSRARVARINYDAFGTFATAPTLSAWSDNTHTAPVAGTQPGAQSGSPIINGNNPDTGTAPITSYLKANMYGTAGTTDPVTGNAGTTLLVTSGTAGSVTPAGASWLTTWQSLQGAIQLITFTTTPPATTAGNIYFTVSLFTGPGMSLGTLLPVITFTYSFV